MSRPFFSYSFLFNRKLDFRSEVNIVRNRFLRLDLHPQESFLLIHEIQENPFQSGVTNG